MATPYYTKIETDSKIEEKIESIVLLDLKNTNLNSFFSGIYVGLGAGQSVSLNAVTIPIGNVNELSFGAPIVPIYNTISEFTGKKVKLTLKYKLGGDISKLSYAGFYIYAGGLPMTITNRTSSIDAFGIASVSAEWLVVNPIEGQIYANFINAAGTISNTTIELIDIYYSIIDYIEEISEKGDFRYLTEKLINEFTPITTSEKSIISLPSVIPVAIGSELNVYTKNIRPITGIQSEYLPLYIKSANDGVMKDNRFQYSKIPNGNKSTFDITVIESSTGGYELQRTTKTIKDVEINQLLTGKPMMNVLSIGDSISEHGWYELELSNLFKTAEINGGSNIRYFGTRQNTANTWEVGMTNVNNISLPLYTECRGGWWTTNFLTPERNVGNDMDAPNPFWNASRVGGADTDFVWYLSQINALPRYTSDPIISIDVFTIALGSNDMGVLTVSQYIANINLLITKMWRDFPDCIILIIGIPPRSLHAYTTEDYENAKWDKALYDEFEVPKISGTGTGRSYIIPIAYWVDRDKGYGKPNVSRLPNEFTLLSGHTSGWYDTLHPYILGHLQMADAIWSGWQNAINEHNIHTT